MPTALVDQDSHAVRAFTPVPLEAFSAALAAAMADGRPAALKVGLLPSEPHAAALADAIGDHLDPAIPIVVDPVLSGGVGAGGRPLSGAAVYLRLLRGTAGRPLLLTPNAPELAALADVHAPSSLAELEAAALALADALSVAVLAKGGHLDPPGTDVLVAARVARRLPPAESAVRDVHGTGCRLSSAIAAALAHGLGLPAAVADARSYLAWSFARAVAQVGSGRPQFAAAGAVLHAADRFDREPVPRVSGPSRESHQ